MSRLRRSILSALIALVMCVPFIAAQPAAAAPSLVFSDEFNSAPLNTSAWQAATPWGTRYTTGELEYYDPANLSFVNGGLRITSEKRSTNGYSYASGIVTSLNRAKFSYGYFEIRAKLPKGKGIWPAFWLTNDRSLEIDALELLGDRPGRVYMTYHKNGSQIAQYVYNGSDLSTGYHTYAVDWQPTYIKWYVDGVLYGTYNGSIPSDPMWICLNTAVGGAWPGSPDSTTVFPQYYDIDYVRVYTAKPDATTPPPVTDPTTPTNPTNPTTPTNPASGKSSVYRFYNRYNGSHFYTSSVDEANRVRAAYGATYTYEGVAYTISTASSANKSPLYRFYNNRTGSHFYTASVAERDKVISAYPGIFTYEGVAYNVSAANVAGSTPIYRFYNVVNGTHFYTASIDEVNRVIANYSNVYAFEGPAFYVVQ
ncbi:MAG: family 16 glycosylhydrolase [Coriobacteriia bacterium]